MIVVYLLIVFFVILVCLALLYSRSRKKKFEEKDRLQDEVSLKIEDVKKRLHDVRFRRPKQIRIDLEEKPRI